MSEAEIFVNIRALCPGGNCEGCFRRREYMLAVTARVAVGNLTTVEGARLVNDSYDPTCGGPLETAESRDGCMPKECQRSEGSDFYIKLAEKLPESPPERI